MIPLLFAAALQSEIVLQTNVIEKVSCGAGCHYKIEQLTNMVEIGDGWRKIKVKSTPYIWKNATVLEQRAPVFDSLIGSGVSTSWSYSNCQTNIFTTRSKEYFAPPPSPPDVKNGSEIQVHSPAVANQTFTVLMAVFFRGGVPCVQKQKQQGKVLKT